MVRSTQKEIRPRARLRLGVLLLLNFGMMTWNSRYATEQPVSKAWAQSAFVPAQRVTTGLGDAGLGFFRGLAEMRDARAENETLRERLAQAGNALREARAARDENEGRKRLPGV